MVAEVLNHLKKLGEFVPFFSPPKLNNTFYRTLVLSFVSNNPRFSNIDSAIDDFWWYHQETEVPNCSVYARVPRTELAFVTITMFWWLIIILCVKHSAAHRNAAGLPFVLAFFKVPTLVELMTFFHGWIWRSIWEIIVKRQILWQLSLENRTTLSEVSICSDIFPSSLLPKRNMQITWWIIANGFISFKLFFRILH